MQDFAYLINMQDHPSYYSNCYVSRVFCIDEERFNGAISVHHDSGLGVDTFMENLSPIRINNSYTCFNQLSFFNATDDNYNTYVVAVNILSAIQQRSMLYAMS